MTTATAPRRSLQDANLTSIVGMVFGAMPLFGLGISIAGLVIALRERSHPGFALIGIGLGIISTATLVVAVLLFMHAVAVTGFDIGQTYTPEELKSFFERVSKS